MQGANSVMSEIIKVYKYSLYVKMLHPMKYIQTFTRDENIASRTGKRNYTLLNVPKSKAR